MNWFRSKPNREVARLHTRIRELETELEVVRAKLTVQQAEIDGLSCVVSRDRARVQAEQADYHHRRALAEGMPHERTGKGTS